MRTYFILVLIAIIWGASNACSVFHIASPDAGDVIGRTLELGGKVIPSNKTQDPFTGWEIVVHPPNTTTNWIGPVACGTKSFVTEIGFVSIDGDAFGHHAFATEGMNSFGLTVSELTLRQSQYQSRSSATEDSVDVCWLDFTAWVLTHFETVAELQAALAAPSPSFRVVGPLTELSDGFNSHWTVDDPSGDHIVVEFLDGVAHVHNNTVGTLTNDPDFRWHLRNLNRYPMLSPKWPSATHHIAVDTEIGTVPRVVGHGYNLMGMPGDYSPTSRFVRLFYLKSYAALNHPPQNFNQTIALATAILNNVFIPMGAVASDRKIVENYEFTQYSVIKVPRRGSMYVKDYYNNQWRLVRVWDILKKQTKTTTMRLGTPFELGVRDMTDQFEH